MARIAFDVDEKTKREIRIRLAEEGKTLSEVMRALCLYYKNFGLSMVSSDHQHDQEGKGHFTTTLYLDEESTRKLNELSARTGKIRSNVVSFLLKLSSIGREGEIELNENDNDIQDD